MLDLLAALRKLIADVHQVYLVIDALDESSDQHELLGILLEIANWELDNLHLLATSRRERYIEDRLTPIVSSRTGLDSDLVDADIRAYLRITMLRDFRFKMWSAGERQEVEDSLMQRAQGM